MKYQFMPMFWGDFLANTMHLTAQEAGAYLFLIAHAWEHDGNIPVKDLQRVARVSNNHWYQVRARLEPFFTPTTGVTGDPHHGGTFWTHERVAQELTRATEISNKRKEAALQMHSKSTSKSSANALQTTPHTTLQLPIEKLSNGKGSEPPPVQVQGNYRDPGIDYRAPPTTKSDHVLAPLPAKQPPRPPAQKQATDKKPAEASRQELDAIYQARK